MSGYTARKINPRVENDLFKVDVEILYDGEVVKTETYETTQDQPEDWPAELVARWIKNREDVQAMPEKIQEGTLDLSEREK